MTTFVSALFLVTILACIPASHQTTCDENEFRCSNGNCIDSFLVCDGEKNCQDGSDETKNVCSKTQVVRCQPFAFRCAYGACIDGVKKCDGKQDCVDNSDENHPDCKASSNNSSSTSINCLTGSYQCESGQCISEWAVCDGESNCRDGSDESDTLCVNFPCPKILGFQCSYGGCIDKEKQCNGVKDCRDGSDEDPILCGHPASPSSNEPSGPIQDGCLLPRQPEGGTFVVNHCTENDASDKCRRVPDTLVSQYTSLTYKCIPGFNLSDTNNVRYCINASWYPATVISCLELCKGLTSSSVDITCTYLGSPIDCSQQVLPGTEATFKCKGSYSRQNDRSSGGSVCGKYGRWSEPLIRCVPDCGIRTGDLFSPLVSRGQNTSAVEYPWYSGLYKFDSQLNKIELFCGGSIITPYLILSVAHCVVVKAKTLRASDVKVVVGKTRRDWEVMDPGEQRLNVIDIYVHPDYTGDENNYGYDLALLELQGSIVIGRVAMPVCVEWTPPWTNIPKGMNGTVVGFGRDEKDKLSDILQTVNLPYLDRDSCRAQALFTYVRYITPDKFCATYVNEAGVQQGDSGGGLVFFKPENHLYYIRGLVSAKPKDENTYAVFTNISVKAHIEFIKDVRRKVMVRHE